MKTATHDEVVTTLATTPNQVSENDTTNINYPKLMFMSLPKDIRISIYTFPSLVRGCLINILEECSRNFDGYTLNDVCDQEMCHGWNNHSTNPLNLCSGPQLPLSTLRASKFVYPEAAHIFYSGNKFFISPIVRGDLQSLRGLAPTAISSMTSLHISLKERRWERPLYQWMESGHKEIWCTRISEHLTLGSLIWCHRTKGYGRASQTSPGIPSKSKRQRYCL